MDSNLTSIDRRNRTCQRGFVLSEILVVMGITTILVLAVMCFFMLAGRSFAAIFNYVDLDDANRVCMDQLSRDIRQSNGVKNFVTNNNVITLTLDDAGTDLSYSYDGGQRTLTRVRGTDSRVVLQNCDTLHFDLRQRTPKDGSLEVYDAASFDVAKVIDVSWVCSRTIFGRKENTESVQTARIVIRKQGT